LENANEINDVRLDSWNIYLQELGCLEREGLITLPVVPETCKHNAHMFYIKTAGMKERTDLIEHLKVNGVMAVFHYVPLHSATAGQQFGRFSGKDDFTTPESEKLVRLPMWYGISVPEQQTVVSAIKGFYRGS
jgi:dTDP-4-amino-4,6-dideoxygalactose transaminase